MLASEPWDNRPIPSCAVLVVEFAEVDEIVLVVVAAVVAGAAFEGAAVVDADVAGKSAAGVE